MRPLPDLFQECAAHVQALGEAMGRCPHPLTVAHFSERDPNLVAALDQFAYRFAKLQDVISTQLVRRFAVDALREPVEDAPVIDVLNLLERYRYLPSVTRWQEMRAMRNQMAHEYQLSAPELVASVDLAFAMVGEMSQVVSALRQAAVERGAL